MESVVKLLAFTADWIVGRARDVRRPLGPAQCGRDRERQRDGRAHVTRRRHCNAGPFSSCLSAFAIILLAAPVPRHGGGEPDARRAPKLAGWLLPLYLVAINIFVLPVAIAGLLQFGSGEASDLFVLTLPMANDMPVVTLITFIGGFSAATAMVIVASVAVAIMVSNDIIVPVVLRRRNRRGQSGDFCGADSVDPAHGDRRHPASGLRLLPRRRHQCRPGLHRTAVVCGDRPACAGILRRAALAAGQRPRRHRRPCQSGIAIWAYMLLVPSLGGPDNSHVALTDLRFRHSRAPRLSPAPPIRPAVQCRGAQPDRQLPASMSIGSLSRRPKSIERIQSAVFIPHSRQADHGRAQLEDQGDRGRSQTDHQPLSRPRAHRALVSLA
jgi:hypothetical protein